jgi:glycerophosphoryl diester phosphodiesterase
MAGLDWLTAQPVAHRGLHDAAAGIIENTSSAISAAVAEGFAVEVDLQITADGEAVVHHDDALGRLTEGDARLDSLTAVAVKQVPFRTTADRIMTLSDLCDLVAGRVPLVIELKSHFDGDRRLVARTVEVLTDYAGPSAVMSFDPDQVAAVRDIAPGLPRGIVAERWYTHPHWARLSAAQKRDMGLLLHAPRTRPHFIAYRVQDLPTVATWIARRLFGTPLLTWTVRTDADRRQAERFADQMIFEGFRPETGSARESRVPLRS